MKKIINPWTHNHEYDCFACAPNNPIGLHMTFYEDNDDVVSYWQPSEHYQGWLNTLHGGIIATLIDEVCAWVITRKLQTTGMTTNLNVTYKHPLHTDEQQITLRARIKEMRRNIATLEAEVYNTEDELCASAVVTYYTMNAERAKEMGFQGCEVEKEQFLPF